jgi:spore coat polysaccharide biosynthesis predicted glycosyltransferase SpsG
VKVAFRVDSGGGIEYGHVSRCLTLADELAKGGSQCVVLARPVPGNARALIGDRGFSVLSLDASAADEADASLNAFTGPMDLLAVSHFGLDAGWEPRLEFRGSVQFLGSPALSYRRSANIVVDGGWTSW